MSPARAIAITSMLAAALVGAGCARPTSDPARATREYPYRLHLAETVDAEGNTVRAPQVADIHVFRDDIWLELVNSTARSFESIDLWVNQQYVRHIDALPAGGSVRVSLFDFYDHLGERFNAGGFFRSIEPTPVRLVAIQYSGDEPLLGLVTIRSEEID